jgi:hypothetical protein
MTACRHSFSGGARTTFNISACPAYFLSLPQFKSFNIRIFYFQFLKNKI